MLSYIKTIHYCGDKQIHLKIGIHSGTAIFGLIGFHKPQFSLIGDTVNTTSRHCTTAESDTIIISESSYQKIREINTHTLQKKNVTMKGKGVVKVYMLKPYASNKKQNDKIRRNMNRLRNNNRLNNSNDAEDLLKKNDIKTDQNRRLLTNILKDQAQVNKQGIRSSKSGIMRLAEDMVLEPLMQNTPNPKITYTSSSGKDKVSQSENNNESEVVNMNSEKRASILNEFDHLNVVNHELKELFPSNDNMNDLSYSQLIESNVVSQAVINDELKQSNTDCKISLNPHKTFLSIPQKDRNAHVYKTFIVNLYKKTKLTAILSLLLMCTFETIN